MKHFFIGFLVTLLISYLIVAFYMWDLQVKHKIKTLCIYTPLIFSAKI